jgi:hypothetical protein
VRFLPYSEPARVAVLLCQPLGARISIHAGPS